MVDYNIQYEKLNEEKKSIQEEMKKLEELDIIKKYKYLYERDIELNYRMQEVYEKKKIEEYRNCKHILVNGKCVRCLLDCGITNIDRNPKTYDEKIMVYYLMHNALRAYNAVVDCDFNEAHSIYTKIINDYPDADVDFIIEELRKEIREKMKLKRYGSFTC